MGIYIIIIILLNMSSEETLKEIMNYINGQISSMPLGSFNGIISILIALIISESLTKKCFSEILSIGLTKGYSIIENLYVEYQKLNFNANLGDHLKLNEMFSDSFNYFFQGKFKNFKRFAINDAKIDVLFFKIYIIGVKLLVNMKSNNNKIISWTEQEKIDKNINPMKINIFKFLDLN